MAKTAPKESTRRVSSRLNFGEDERRLSHGGHGPEWFRHVTVDPLDLANFVRQFAVMMESGIHILKSLEFLAQSQTDPVLGEVCLELHFRVQNGRSLSDAAHLFKSVFPPVSVALIRIGEETGGLVACLHLLSDWLERDTKIRRRIRSSLAYPAVVLGLSFVLMAVLFYGILPPFLQMLIELKVPLPWPTRLLWAMAGLLHHPLVLFVLALLSWWTYRWIRDKLSDDEFRVHLYYQLERLPIVCSGLREHALQRVSAAAYLLNKSGCETLKLWNLAFRASGDPRHKVLASHLAVHMAQGEPVSDFCAKYPKLFDPLFVQSLTVAEESGKFTKIFGSLQNFYEVQTEERREMVLSLVQPIVLTLVGATVMTCLLSVFVPLYSHLSTL